MPVDGLASVADGASAGKAITRLGEKELDNRNHPHGICWFYGNLFEYLQLLYGRGWLVA